MLKENRIKILLILACLMFLQIAKSEETTPPFPADNKDKTVIANEDKDTDKDTAIALERRKHIRFNTAEVKVPVNITSNNKIQIITDISRGGIGIKHNKTLSVGEIIPVNIKYKGVEINTNAKIVSATDNRAGAEFCETEKTVLNKILYLSIMLEADNDMLVTSVKS